MSLPRTLSLSAKNELCSTPHEALKPLRRDHEILTNANSLSEVVKGQYIEMQIRIPPDAEKWSGVQLTCGTKIDDNVLVGVDFSNSAIVVDCRHSGGPFNVVPVAFSGVDEINLHVFVDGSIVEVFVDDRTPISSRVYFENPQALHVRLVGEAKAELWKLKI
jgi:sucrose-6-phosphate hydrolase SacC (GH32 family)